MREDTPSSTALLIARATILLSQEPKYAPLVPDDAAEACRWFVQACDGGDRFLRRCGRHWFRAVMFLGERLTLPGILVHYALRKRLLEETVRQAVAAGCRQVVVLGAGFDTLALRLHAQYPQVSWLEIDHPATQGVKRAVLSARGLGAANLVLLPLDLGQGDVEQALTSSPAYRSQSPTVFVAEGLLMYLPPEKVAALFGAARRLIGPTGRFAFTFLEPQPGGGIDFQVPSRFIGFWLKRRREPFRWGVRREALPAFLGPLGFSPDAVHTPEGLRRRFLPKESSDGAWANGDLICVATPILSTNPTLSRTA